MDDRASARLLAEAAAAPLEDLPRLCLAHGYDLCAVSLPERPLLIAHRHGREGAAAASVAALQRPAEARLADTAAAALQSLELQGAALAPAGAGFVLLGQHGRALDETDVLRCAALGSVASLRAERPAGAAEHRIDELQAQQARDAMLRADVTHALHARDEVRPVLQACCEALVKHADAAFARIWTLNREAQVLELQASAGMYTHLDGGHARVPVGKFKIGLIAAEGEPHLTNDVQYDPRVGDKEWAKREGLVAFAGYPLRVEGQVTGVLAMFSAQPLDDALLRSMGTVTDLVAQGIERLNAERALEKRAEELAATNHELEQFAYVASHDLQEPLRMVASYAQLLLRRYGGKLDKDADEFIHYMVEGVTRMQALINDLLAFSRLGTRSREVKAVEPAEAVKNALFNLRAALDDAKAQVTVGALPAVRADLPQLAQLFQNLVGNAVKFRQPSRSAEITVEGRPAGKFVELTVRDNGIGIEEQYFNRIFVIFQRLHGRDAYPGTGIGLALCKKIVERHGGRIWLTSKPGEGSTFRFTLPAA